MVEEKISQYIIIVISLIGSLILKDFLSSFVFGLSFYIDKNFHEGDNVYIDNEEATIIKIGFMRTIFRMKKTGYWYFVHNSKIKSLKLEKKVEE
jgi:small-conductance mechanosensitive channel